MNVVFCWSDITGYLAASLRALAKHQDISLSLVSIRNEREFSSDILHGIDCRIFSNQENQDTGQIAALVHERKPDIVVISGWVIEPFVDLVFKPEFKNVKFLMGLDTPLKYTWRQRLARLKIGPYLDRLACVVVAGERSWQYGRRLSIPETKLRRGVYAYDETLFGPVAARRAADNRDWPRRFLYVGRYAPEKGMDVLLPAYRQYRRQVTDPWPLTCCGSGTLKNMLSGEPGIEDRGFIQPGGLPAVLAEHGVFILASRYEPWGVVIAEALGSGMPVICTEACGASVELVRSYYNGLTVATENVPELTRAMRWMHENHALLPQMGRRGAQFAEAFSSEVWGLRWAQMCRELMGPS